MNAIVASARDFRKSRSCLESIGCVAMRDKFECVLKGEIRQQESGSEVVMVLHEEEKIDATVTDFPLVYIDVQKIQEEIHKIQHFKKKNKIECMDEKTYQELRGKLDSKYLLSLANRHSNLVAIDICTTKSSMGGDIIEELTSIVIYCFAKGFVPIGENVFPKEIMGIQTDIREAYALALGTRDYNNPIGPGCSIGLENHDSTGSIGFFLRHKHDGHLAFVSSAHVLFDLNTLRDLANKNQENPSHECRVVQPSDTDSRAITLLTDRICGHVRSVHFNRTGEEKCKDFVVVASEGIRNPGNILQHPSISAANRHQSGCNNWPNGYEIQDIGIPSTDRDDNVTERSINKTVIKVGRTTDLTKGEYAGPIRMVNVRDGNGGSFILFDLIKIKACRSPRFSARGDSGAAIFLKFGNTLKPFGIVEASMMQTNLTVAIPITEVKTVCEDYELQPFDRQQLGVQDDDDDENMMTMMVMAMIMMIAVVKISLNVDT